MFNCFGRRRNGYSNLNLRHIVHSRRRVNINRANVVTNQSASAQLQSFTSVGENSSTNTPVDSWPYRTPPVRLPDYEQSFNDSSEPPEYHPIASRLRDERTRALIFDTRPQPPKYFREQSIYANYLSPYASFNVNLAPRLLPYISDEPTGVNDPDNDNPISGTVVEFSRALSENNVVRARRVGEYDSYTHPLESTVHPSEPPPPYSEFCSPSERVPTPPVLPPFYSKENPRPSRTERNSRRHNITRM